MLSDLTFRLRALFKRNAVETELDEELRFHFEQQVEKYVGAGHTRAEAVRRARLVFGGFDQVKEECRDSRGVNHLETLLQDVRYGLRMLRKNPGFTAVAVITLALGIGANTALFSVVNGVLLNPLPYPHPEQLVTVHESKPNFEAGSISYPNFRDWRKDNHVFSSLAIHRRFSFSLTGLGEAEQVNASFVSSDFFPLLGMNPLLGRTFAEGEDEIGAAPLAMISAGLWKRKFASAPGVIGKTLTLDGRDYTVIGVVPESFDLSLRTFRPVEVYAGIGQWSNPLLPERDAGLGIHGIGRLKPGVTLAQARADMNGVTQNLAAAYPNADKGIGANIISIHEDMFGGVQPVLLVLLGAVGFVLLIACVNVANLLLARSTSRVREFAVRTALGAGQKRLLRQLLTESILLALGGGGLGLLLAYWGTRGALGALTSNLPRAAGIRLDSHVLLFTTAVSLLAGVFFGLAPALKTSQPQLHETLKESGRGSRGTRHRAQGVFVVLEMALALVLLIGAGLMIRSLAVLWSIDPGFRPNNVLTFNLSFPPAMMTAGPDAIRAAARNLDERFASIPGVQAVSQSWGAFPFGYDDEQLFWIDGQPKPTLEKDMNWSLAYMVSPGYLQAMGISLQRGRFFTSKDNEHAASVVVVDEVFSRKYFGDQDPVGKRIHLDSANGNAEIVGVVGHVNQWGLDLDATQSLRAELYIPYQQMPDRFITMVPGGGGTFVIVRSGAPTAALVNSLRQTSQQINSQQVMHDVETLNDMISDSLAGRRFSMILLGVFAALALVLSSIGIYGVISYLVGQRTREIGIRLALGARRGDVLRLILGHGVKLAAIGILIGLLGSLGLTHLMSSMLYGVSATDPLTFISVAILLTIVALAACYIPARRATRVDPIQALRYE
jgi:predicted permease